MLRLLCNIIVIVVVFCFVALFSCATTGGSCQSPLHDACSAKAAQIAPELAQVAAQQGKTTDLMTTEFMGACEGQLQYDLDQTLPAILAVINPSDAGKDAP